MAPLKFLSTFKLLSLPVGFFQQFESNFPTKCLNVVFFVFIVIEFSELFESELYHISSENSCLLPFQILLLP